MAPTGGSARKTVTVLFCDVTGSTALGEHLDPESLREVIHGYFAEMRAVIERHGGTVEKFIGDAVMAVFGVPRVHEDDALRAVRAAAEMQGALTETNDRFQRDFGVRIQARIGVNTGEVIAGDPTDEGSSFVSGDAVNVAARLQQSAEPGDVILGEATYRLVRAAVIGEPLVPLAAKGKSEPLVAYRLVVVDPGGEMLPRRLDAPLVGREEELAVLRRALDEVVASTACRLATVVGSAGLGKSRLAHEFLSGLGDRARVLRGRCLPYGEGITFWPVAEILEGAAGIQADDPPGEARAKIDALLPEQHKTLGERLSGILGAGEVSGSLQETFLAVRRILEELGRAGPVVVLFDDIQWAEDTFIDLIQYLSTFTAAPLLILCLARPELLETRPDWTQVGQVVRLQPLDAHGSDALVANLLGDEGSSTGIATTIVQAAEGNPLFIEEMLRMLVDHGVLVRDDGGWAVVGDLASVGRPETVHAVIAARLDGLDAGERAILQTASVIGEIFWWNAVADLRDDAGPVDVARRLQALVRKDLIRPDPSTFFSEDAFRFGHLLIRDVAYGSLPKKARALMHERFARWVEERAAQRTSEYAEIIGYHAEQAARYLGELGPADERTRRLASTAAAHLSAAGNRSFDGGDMPAAVNLTTRAAALLSDQDPGLVPILRVLALALTDNGRLDDAEEAYARMRDAGRTQGDRRAEMRAVSSLQFLRILRTAGATHDDYLETVEPAHAYFEQVGDDEGLSETVRYMGTIDLWAGRCEVALQRFEESLAAAKRAGDRRLASSASHWMGLALTQGPTPVSEAIERIDSLVRDNAGDRMFRWQTDRYKIELLALSGAFDEARRLAEEDIAFAAEMGLEGPPLAAGLLRASGEEAYRSGDLDRAESTLRRAADILVRIGDKGHLASVAPDLARVLLELPGREEDAVEILELGERSAIDDDVDAQVRLRSVRAVVLSRRGEHSEAESFARDAVERAWKTDYPILRGGALDALAEVLGRAGRIPEAVEARERAIAIHEAKGDLSNAEKDRRLLAELRSTDARSGRHEGF